MPHDPGPCNEVETTDSNFYTATRVTGLERIGAHERMYFDTITSDHYDVFYTRPEVVTATHDAADEYWRIAGQRDSLRVNAASLIYGGIEDIEIGNPWGPPHNTHRVGTDVDLDGRADNQRVWDLVEDAAVSAGFHHCDVHRNNHQHCYYRSYY